jgi:hypothetical protein
MGCTCLCFPFSYWDDSLILGPAIGLVEGYGLHNMYLSSEFYPAQTYLFYPPTFFWVMAGWIATFGRSVESLSLFWAACALGISLPAGALLTRLSRTRMGYAVAPILVLGCIAYTGYRYEILALATFFSGIALSVADRRSLGYLLLCLTPTIAPTMVGSCIVALGALAFHHRRDHPLREAGRLALTLSLALVWLSASVSGNLIGLVETMYHYRSVRIGMGGREMQDAMPLFVLQTGLLTVAFARIVLGRGWGEPLVRLPLLLVATWALTLFTHARPSVLVAMNLVSTVLFVLVLAAIFVARGGSRRTFVSRHAPGIALGGVGACLLWLNVTYASTIPIRPLAPALVQRARALAAQAIPGQAIVVDARVMRDVLHFPKRLDMQDAMVRHAWPAIYQDYHRIPANELWIVGPGTLDSDLTAPLVRNGLDALYISPGMAAPRQDGICRLDRQTALRWRTRDPADLVALTCR